MCVFIWKIIKSHQQANIYISPDQSSGYASACYIEERRCFVFKTEEMIQKHKLRKVISVVLATVCIVLLTGSHWHCLSLLPHVFNLLFAYCSRPHGNKLLNDLSLLWQLIRVVDRLVHPAVLGVSTVDVVLLAFTFEDTACLRSCDAQRPKWSILCRGGGALNSAHTHTYTHCLWCWQRMTNSCVNFVVSVVVGPRACMAACKRRAAPVVVEMAVKRRCACV